tara:strand:- start:692 stop:1108 length:417 start_codon:yes stop_codon:yes gene_type:complete
MNAETAEKEKNQTEENQTEENKDQVKSSDKPDKNETTDKNDENAKKSEPSSAAVSNLRLLENIEVRLTVEVGNTEIKIKDLLRLNEGSVIELDRLAGDALDILANGTKIAKGEVVMVGEKFGIRFTEVATPEELMQNL